MTAPGPAGPALHRSAMGAVPAAPRLGRSYAITLGGSAGVMVLTIFTGVLAARLLGPDGRGAVGAIAAWAMIASFVGGVGLREGMAWSESKDPRLAPTVLSSTIVATCCLAVLTIVAMQPLIPIGFGAQPERVVFYAHVATLWVLPYMLYIGLGSLCGARQYFGIVTVMRVGQPLLYAIGLGVAWRFDRAGVAEVLALQAASFVVIALFALVVLVRSSGLGRPDVRLVKRASGFGIRAYGNEIGHLTNARLDLLVLPAVLAAADIGLYVVAVSAASSVVGLFGSLGLVVFPAAARAGGEQAVAMAQRAMRLVLTAAVGTGILIAVTAPFLVRLLYGEEFAGAVKPLWLLLPGVCCWALSSIVGSSLKAIGRPGAASTAQFVGVGVTVVGLLVLLRPLGIAGAAITSSLAYATVLAVGLATFTRATGTSLATIVGPRSLLNDGRWLIARLSNGDRRSTG